MNRALRPGRLQVALDRERTGRREEVVQLCGFRVGDEEYALDIMRIKEIINPLPITRVPKAAPFVEGVVELRGTILPIVDMRKRFDLPPLTQQELQVRAVSRARKYLIVPIDGRPVGLIVDRVSDVIRVSRETIRPAPALTQSDAARYFAGVCHHRERILMVLDLDAILSSTEKISLAGLDGGALGGVQIDREARSAAVIDREARSAAVIDREARSAAVIDREARSAAVIDREARSAAVKESGTAT